MKGKVNESKVLDVLAMLRIVLLNVVHVMEGKGSYINLDLTILGNDVLI